MEQIRLDPAGRWVSAISPNQCHIPRYIDSSGFLTGCLPPGIDDEIEGPIYTQRSASIQRVIRFLWLNMSCSGY